MSLSALNDAGTFLTEVPNNAQPKMGMKSDPFFSILDDLKNRHSIPVHLNAGKTEGQKKNAIRVAMDTDGIERLATLKDLKDNVFKNFDVALPTNASQIMEDQKKAETKAKFVAYLLEQYDISTPEGIKKLMEIYPDVIENMKATYMTEAMMKMKKDLIVRMGAHSLEDHVFQFLELNGDLTNSTLGSDYDNKNPGHGRVAVNYNSKDGTANTLFMPNAWDLFGVRKTSRIVEVIGGGAAYSATERQALLRVVDVIKQFPPLARARNIFSSEELEAYKRSVANYNATITSVKARGSRAAGDVFAPLTDSKMAFYARRLADSVNQVLRTQGVFVDPVGFVASFDTTKPTGTASWCSPAANGSTFTGGVYALMRYYAYFGDVPDQAFTAISLDDFAQDGNLLYSDTHNF